MLDKKFSPERQSAFAARFEAQKIAFGPVVFQCVRYAWKRGILQAIADTGDDGLSVEELSGNGRWSRYALNVVLETCLSAGVVCLQGGRYVLDKAGFCLLTDTLTQVNFDFNHDVCYQALFALDESLDAEQPLGLKTFGQWPTLYEGLSAMPEPARTSWLAFDHYYSDTSFPAIMPDVFATGPKRVMDVGANTGKFSLAALAANDRVELNLVDLPGQLAVADRALRMAGVRERAVLHSVDLLDEQAELPGGMDLIWMSQFLSCFPEDAIARIFERTARALAANGQMLVLDTFWDRQKYDIASYCLINTSPYFTAVASGKSKIYQSSDYVRLAERAGLRLLTMRDGIGYCHSLLRFAKGD
jgi:O-methyltransferase domain